MNADVVIIGAGPAGIFTALEMVKKGSKQKIIMVEKGQAVENRHCPKDKTKKCVNCKPYCHITTGFSGAGAFSDGKLSLSYEVGGDLPTLITPELAQETINYADRIYLDFGADEHIEGLGNDEERKEIRKHAIQAGLKLVDCPIRHMGTEKAQGIYYAIEKYLQEHGVEMYFGYECSNLILENDVCKGVSVSNGKVDMEIYAKHTVVATGRRGADWLEKLCAEHNIAHAPGTVDIGVRVELPAEVFSRLTDELYESKIVYRTEKFEDMVRTFCMNPRGVVVNENTNGIITVNGHSYEDPAKHTNNTNFALLVSKHFSEPFHDSNGYGESIARLSNMLGGGVMVQRFGDLIRGRRSTKARIEESFVTPTLSATPGDLSLVMPKRILDGIIEMIYALDKIAPGTADDDTLLYGVEVKFYNMEVEIDENLETCHKGLFVIGDCSGVTHSLSHASASGVYVARYLEQEYFNR